MLTIYTDGSCEPNPGPGGWSAIILENGAELTILRGSDPLTTNNRMEFSAGWAALTWMHHQKMRDAVIYSDSQYMVNAMKIWAYGWERKGWRKALKNLDLIQPMHELRKGMNVAWKWVRGHNGHELNEKADREAENARIHRVPTGALYVPRAAPELILL